MNLLFSRKERSRSDFKPRTTLKVREFKLARDEKRLARADRRGYSVTFSMKEQA